MPSDRPDDPIERYTLSIREALKTVNLTTEKVSESQRTPNGGVKTITFWIAYPDWIGAYGMEHDRISFAWGRGDSAAKALANAVGGELA